MSNEPSESPSVSIQPSTEPSASARTIEEEICARNEFTTFCALIRLTGLNGVLDNGRRRALQSSRNDDVFTVFAPTNDAFTSIVAPGNLTARGVLKNLVELHIINDSEIRYAQLSCGTKYRMRNQLYSRTECSAFRKYQVGNGNKKENYPEIIDRNIKASNGIIHAVNHVLRMGNFTIGDDDSKIFFYF
eukprot:jgi/Psemu1/302959/fgenesh1_kg.87_\